MTEEQSIPIVTYRINCIFLCFFTESVINRYLSKNNWLQIFRIKKSFFKNYSVHTNFSKNVLQMLTFTFFWEKLDFQWNLNICIYMNYFVVVPFSIFLLPNIILIFLYILLHFWRNWMQSVTPCDHVQKYRLKAICPSINSNTRCRSYALLEKGMCDRHSV